MAAAGWVLSSVVVGGAESPPTRERSPSPRTRLLEAALELFGTVGYEVTSIGALCRAAKVSTRDFHRLAGDRMQLFVAVFGREMDRILGPVGAATAAAEPILAVRAELWARHWLRTALEDRRRHRIRYTEAIGVNPELDRRRREVLHGSCALCARQLATCAEARGERRLASDHQVAGGRSWARRARC
jgi:AcrR family transcriptional regulator